jgi:hypothetical protein
MAGSSQLTTIWNGAALSINMPVPYDAMARSPTLGTIWHGAVSAWMCPVLCHAMARSREFGTTWNGAALSVDEVPVKRVSEDPRE